MAVNRIPLDPDVGVPDLVRRLTDDSKRLLSDEVLLAKLEVKDSVRTAGHATMWLGIAMSIGIVAMVALTLLVATLIGRVSAGHMWIGAVVTGVLEVVLAAWMIKRGIGAFTEPSYTLEDTRESLTETADWVKTAH